MLTATSSPNCTMFLILAEKKYMKGCACSNKSHHEPIIKKYMLDVKIAIILSFIEVHSG